MKIFMLIKKLRYSGAYKMFLWVAKMLQDNGMNVTICTFMPTELSNIPYGVKWINREDLAKKSLLAKVATIRSIMKQGDYDISISFLLDANVYNTLACLGLRTKSVICERNDPFKPHYWALKFWKPLLGFADGAVFQLPRVAQYYNNVKAPIAVIPNPIEPPLSCVPEWDDRDKVILTLGRLDLFQKRQDVLIEAFSEFHAQHPEYELHIYGNGDDESKIQQLIAEFHLENAIKLMGVTYDSATVYCKARIFVLSSDFEGIPNALMEAMAYGLPCVSTDCRPGGAALLVQDGSNGYLIPAGNARMLAERLRYLVETPEVAEQLGNSAKTISQTFSQEIIAQRWIEYIESIK